MKFFFSISFFLWAFFSYAGDSIEDLVRAIEDGDDKKSEYFINNLSMLDDYHHKSTKMFYSPLHMAVLCDNLYVAKLLLDKGDYVNISNYHNYTPLQIAAYDGNLMMAILLLYRGATINKVNCLGATALLLASQNGQLEVAKLLLANGGVILRPSFKHDKYNLSNNINEVIAKNENLKAKALVRNIDLPSMRRINKINNLLSRYFFKTYLIKDYTNFIFPKEVWLLIFSSLENSDCLNLILVCKNFFNITINSLIDFSPLDKKIYFLKKHNIKIPKVVTWRELEEFAKENGLEF